MRIYREYRKYKATFHVSTPAGATGGSPSRASLAQSAQAAGRRLAGPAGWGWVTGNRHGWGYSAGRLGLLGGDCCLGAESKR